MVVGIVPDLVAVFPLHRLCATFYHHDHGAKGNLKFLDEVLVGVFVDIDLVKGQLARRDLLAEPLFDRLLDGRLNTEARPTTAVAVEIVSQHLSRFRFFFLGGSPSLAGRPIRRGLRLLGGEPGGEARSCGADSRLYRWWRLFHGPSSQWWPDDGLCREQH